VPIGLRTGASGIKRCAKFNTGSELSGRPNLSDSGIEAVSRTTKRWRYEKAREEKKRSCRPAKAGQKKRAGSESTRPMTKPVCSPVRRMKKAAGIRSKKDPM